MMMFGRTQYCRPVLNTLLSTCSLDIVRDTFQTKLHNYNIRLSHRLQLTDESGSLFVHNYTSTCHINCFRWHGSFFLGRIGKTYYVLRLLRMNGKRDSSTVGRWQCHIEKSHYACAHFFSIGGENALFLNASSIPCHSQGTFPKLINSQDTQANRQQKLFLMNLLPLIDENKHIICFRNSHVLKWKLC